MNEDVKVNICFIEDSKEDLLFALNIIDEFGLEYNHVCYKDKKKFINSLDKKLPDIIISDFSLPTFNGLDVLKYIKKKKIKVPVIMVSGAIGEERAVELLKAGATDFILKGNLSRLPHAIVRAIKEYSDATTLHVTHELLRESEQRLNMAIEGSSIGLWDWEIGKEIYLNKQFADMIHRSLSETYELIQNWETHIHPDDFAQMKQAIVRHLKGETIYYRSEFRLKTSEDDYKWVLAHGRVIARNDDYKATRMIGIHVDINERKVYERALKDSNDNLEIEVAKQTKGLKREVEKRKKTEKELKSAMEQAESASREKSRFLANMSHEIRSPLNAIIGFSQILLNQVEKASQLPGSFEEYLGYIKTSGETLSEVINDILDLSKIEEGKMILSSENIQLNQLIRGIFHMNKMAAKTKSINFNYIIETNTPKYVKSDRIKLKQVLMNLVSNAIKFTDEKKNVTLIAGYDEKSNRLIFKVVDEGIGIPEKHIDQIFTRFKQLDNSVTRKYSGTGLGLAISKQIVDLMNGVIKVISKEKKGSTFIVEIPYISGKSEERNSHKLNDHELRFDENSKVLIIEDNKVNIKVLQALLKELKINSMACESAKKGIEIASKFKPNLIFMDMHMPEFDGISAAKEILSSKECKNVPIIALSADAFEETKKAAFDAGINDYLTKPVEINRFKEVLKIHLKTKPNSSIKDEAVQMDGELRVKIDEELSAISEIPIHQTERLIQKIEFIERLIGNYTDYSNFNLEQLKDAVYDGDQEYIKKVLKSMQNG